MAGRRGGRYPQEYRECIVQMVRAGRIRGPWRAKSEPSEQTIQNRVRRAHLNAGRRSNGPTTEARGDLRGAEAGEQSAHRGNIARIRLISARPASRKERRVYHERTLR